MTSPEERKRSAYMEWAKLSSKARFNLATSGLTNVTLAEFPLQSGDLEITGGGYGYGPLVERIAQYTGAPADCIVTAEGTSMANHLAMAAILEPGDEVLIEQPTYGLLLDLAHYLGARVRRIERPPENDFAISLGKLEAAIGPETRLIVLTNLHNPSGALVSQERLQAVGELASRSGILVLVDEVYLPMLFDSTPPSSFSLGENFVVTSSLTKTYGLSGLRCGWILAAPELVHRMWRLNDLFAATAAHPAERMSVMAFDHLDQFRARARDLLTANRALLDAFLDSRDDLDCFRPPAGSVVFPRLTNVEPGAFFQLLREKHETSVVPGVFFEMPHHFRLGIGCPTEELREGLTRVGAALDEVAT